MENKYIRLLKDTFIFAVGSLGSKVILFLLVPLYTNYMTTSEYGTADLVFTVCQLLIPFFSLVIFDAVLRFGLSKDHCPEDVLRVGLDVCFAGSMLTAAAALLTGPDSFMGPWRWYICVQVCTNMLYSVMMNYLKVKGLNKLYASLSIFQTFVMAALNVLLLMVFHTGVQGYLMSTILSNVALLGLLLWWGRLGAAYRKGRFCMDTAWEMIRYSAPLILNSVSWWIIHSSDKIMVEMMVGTAALGVFSVAAKIPSLINVIISFFSQAWGIASAREMESTNDPKFYSQVFSAYNLLTCAACIGFVSVMKLFMNLYVGPEFREAWRYVPLLLASAVFASASSYYGSLYGALKKSVSNMLTTLMAAVINILVNYVFILLVGVWGAVIGTVVSYFVIVVVRAVDIGKSIALSIDWRRIGLNWTIMMGQAILVSLDIQVYWVSAAAVCLYGLLNYREALALVSRKGQ